MSVAASDAAWRCRPSCRSGSSALAAVLFVVLRPTIGGTVTDDYRRGDPLANVQVTYGDQRATTDGLAASRSRRDARRRHSRWSSHHPATPATNATSTPANRTSLTHCLATSNQGAMAYSNC